MFITKSSGLNKNITNEKITIALFDGKYANHI